MFIPETANIWTHLFAVFFFIYLGHYHFSNLMTTDERQQWHLVLPWFAFFSTIVLSFGLSVVFHTFCCMSERAYFVLATIDYMGISVVTFGGYWPVIAFNFHCVDAFKSLYYGVLISIGLVVAFISTYPAFATPRLKNVRLC
jgi:predicted membrane channel-forming protein YqfA (hemolysin III family)